MCIASLAFASAGLLHPHVPFDEAADLTLGIAASHHACDKLAVLLFGIAVLFRAKRDNRKKVFDLRKYPFLDDFSNLFIAGPGRILPLFCALDRSENLTTSLRKSFGLAMPQPSRSWSVPG
jgi:hypothetical protein